MTRTKGYVLARNKKSRYEFIISSEPKPLRIEFVSGGASEAELRIQHAQRLESIGTLAAGVAHDFNNLLTAIMGNTDLALRHIKEGEPLYNRLREIKEAGNKAVGLTQQILDFCHWKADRRIINVNQTISGVYKMLERVLGKRIRIFTDYCEQPAFIYANQGQLEQVLMNLCVNARDAMPEGGELHIKTSHFETNEQFCEEYPFIKPGAFVKIKVTDTGIGMDRKTQERIFEPFYTTKEIGKGTGIGLSMVYNILKEHDSHIIVSSQPGKGTTFNLLLPVHETEPPLSH